MIVMKGRAGGAGADFDLPMSRGVGDEKTASAAGDLDAARDEVCFLGNDPAVILDAGDLAAAFELFEGVSEGVMLGGVEAQRASEIGSAGGDVVLAAEKIENSRFHEWCCCLGIGWVILNARCRCRAGCLAGKGSSNRRSEE